MTEPDRSAVIRVEDLRVSFHGSAVVQGVSFSISAGECLAIVGESGSGKSVTARSLLGLAGGGAMVDAARLELNGAPLPPVGDRRWREIRGGRIGLVLQDALVSLDPLRPIGREIDDSLRLHTDLDRAARRARTLELLDAVGMPDPALRARQRSGELSGGLRQRALIASAIAAEPALVIADEPTTALDATVQAQVLQLLSELREQGTALLLISHDLAVVQHVADRVAVMRDGRIVEQGPTRDVLGAPEHEYTRMLLRSVPSTAPRGVRLTTPQVGSEQPATEQRATEQPATEGGSAPPRATAEHHPASLGERGENTAPVMIEATDLSKSFRRPDGGHLRAVDGVSLTLRAGTTLGVVGESGSGKTTVARIILGLTAPDDGTVTVAGERFSGVPERHRRHRRSLVGAVYQDPLSSFDPRHTVGQILRHAIPSDESAPSQRVYELLDSVALPASVHNRRPLHLSGGQRQRVAIARALAARPRVLICDEPVSALDVSVQAHILDLFNELQEQHGLAYLFISHDLGVVQHMSDEVAVMRGGGIVEFGTAAEVFNRSQHPYTRRLLDATPILEKR